MYGFSGYATNSYASLRSQLASSAPVVVLPTLTLTYAHTALIQPRVVGQSDYGYKFPFVLQDGNGNVINLSGASLAFNVQDSQDPTQTNLFSGAMVIDSGPAGTCHYIVASGNFPNPGTFSAQVVGTWSTEVLTWDGITIVVEPKTPILN